MGGWFFSSKKRNEDFTPNKTVQEGKGMDFDDDHRERQQIINAYGSATESLIQKGWLLFEEIFETTIPILNANKSVGFKQEENTQEVIDEMLRLQTALRSQYSGNFVPWPSLIHLASNFLNAFYLAPTQGIDRHIQLYVDLMKKISEHVTALELRAKVQRTPTASFINEMVKSAEAKLITHCKVLMIKLKELSDILVQVKYYLGLFAPKNRQSRQPQPNNN